MGNALKRNQAKIPNLNHSSSYGLYKRKNNKPFSEPKVAKITELEENKNDAGEEDSWTTTIDTLSVPLSLSVPTGESEQNTDEEGTTSSNDPSSGYSKRSSITSRTTSNTSADFSSFKNLSKISEHTTMHLRPDDLEWMNDVRQYQESEPVFRKKPFNAALKIRPRKVFPRLKWRHLYHQWALRQSPKTYMGKDVLNPYINRILEKKYDDVDLNSSDLEHGIFYLKCTNC